MSTGGRRQAGHETEGLQLSCPCWLVVPPAEAVRVHPEVAHPLCALGNRHAGVQGKLIQIAVRQLRVEQDGVARLGTDHQAALVESTWEDGATITSQIDQQRGPM